MGTLYLVGTPIGNLEDITLRALRILGEVRLIAAEDTRRTGLLLKKYEISTPLLSYYEANKAVREGELLTALSEGDVALVSEAGMPGLSDPGYELVCAAVEEGHAVVPVPGASAPVTALVVSGLPTDRFLYLGFLPRRRAALRELLEQVAAERGTLVMFESPHRLQTTLQELEDALGDRPIAVCREMTKLYEEIWRGSVSQARVYFGEQEPRGEFTLVVGGAVDDPTWTEEQVRGAIAEHLKRGISRSQTARQVAALAGWSRRKVYELCLQEGDDV